MTRARSPRIWDGARCGILVTKFGTVVFVIFKLVEFYRPTLRARPVVGVRDSRRAEKCMGTRVTGVPSRTLSTFTLEVR